MLFIQRISSFLFSMYWLLLSFLSIEHFSPSSSSHPVGKPTVFSWQSVYCLESLFLPLQHYPWVNWVHSLCNTSLPALSETSWNVEILLQFFSLTQLRSAIWSCSPQKNQSLLSVEDICLHVWWNVVGIAQFLKKYQGYI